jgi:hypothetical protein
MNLLPDLASAFAFSKSVSQVAVEENNVANKIQ